MLAALADLALHSLAGIVRLRGRTRRKRAPSVSLVRCRQDREAERGGRQAAVRERAASSTWAPVATARLVVAARALGDERGQRALEIVIAAGFGRSLSPIVIASSMTCSIRRLSLRLVSTLEPHIGRSTLKMSPCSMSSIAMSAQYGVGVILKNMPPTPARLRRGAGCSRSRAHLLGHLLERQAGGAALRRFCRRSSRRSCNGCSRVEALAELPACSRASPRRSAGRGPPHQAFLAVALYLKAQQPPPGRTRRYSPPPSCNHSAGLILALTDPS